MAKQVWVLTEEELTKLQKCMFQHVKLAKEAIEPETSRQRKLDILSEIEWLRNTCNEILERELPNG